MTKVKKIFVLLIGLFVWISACNPNKIPDGLLSEKQMQRLTYDLIIGDSYSSISSSSDSINMLHKAYKAAVLKKYGLDSLQYQKNFDFYYAHPALIEKIYENIKSDLDTLSKKYKPDTSMNRIKLVK